MKINRVYHHYLNCEEYRTNMWKSVPPAERQPIVDKSASLMIDVSAFKAAMVRAVHEWPNSCEAALTASVINHQAWLGHAGCAINHNAPEELTRLAWRTLTEEQQAMANNAADEAKAIWLEKYLGERNA